MSVSKISYELRNDVCPVQRCRMPHIQVACPCYKFVDWEPCLRKPHLCLSTCSELTCCSWASLLQKKNNNDFTEIIFFNIWDIQYLRKISSTLWLWENTHPYLQVIPQKLYVYSITYSYFLFVFFVLLFRMCFKICQYLWAFIVV